MGYGVTFREVCGCSPPQLFSTYNRKIEVKIKEKHMAAEAGPMHTAQMLNEILTELKKINEKLDKQPYETAVAKFKSAAAKKAVPQVEQR